MSVPLKQFVPSSVCLKCDGCCRFQLADSPWRPKTGEVEGIEGTDSQGYLKTVKQAEHHLCTHFNKTDNTCGIYTRRPFECSLYPFVLSKTKEGTAVYMHLACPYIQEKESSEELQEYVEYIKGYLAQAQTKEFLAQNERMLHDYSDFGLELRFLFKI